MNENERDQLLMTLLSKVTTKKCADVKLAPGQYEVNARVELHVAGRVTVGEDVQYTPTAEIPVKTVLALFMRYAGITGPMAYDVLLRAMREAIETGDAVELPEIRDIEACEARIREGLSNLPKKTRKGAVRVDGQINYMEKV